ncbi:MAG: hypothetical protein ABUS54_06285 [Actinomycetota bacterium]
MRRIAVFSLALAALAVPAAALAARDVAADDGVLVVKNASAPYFPQLAIAKSTPVVQLVVTGSVIGQVSDGGKIMIDPGPTGPSPEVTGAGPWSTSSKSDTAQVWNSPNAGFKFRAVGGKFTIVIYGSGVSLVAVGTGSVTLAGTPDDPTDGWYALNGGDRHSMPGQPLKQLIAGANG